MNLVSCSFMCTLEIFNIDFTVKHQFRIFQSLLSLSFLNFYFEEKSICQHHGLIKWHYIMVTNKQRLNSVIQIMIWGEKKGVLGCLLFYIPIWNSLLAFYWTNHSFKQKSLQVFITLLQITFLILQPKIMGTH